MLTNTDKLKLQSIKCQFGSLCTSALLGDPKVKKQLENFGERQPEARAFLRRL